jgi:hypothetical protein
MSIVNDDCKVPIYEMSTLSVNPLGNDKAPAQQGVKPQKTETVDFLSNFVSKKARKNPQAFLRAAYIAYRAAEEAESALQEGRYETFDALAGDTSCEIRAALIALYALGDRASILQELKSLQSREKQQEILKLLQSGTTKEFADSLVSQKTAFVVLSQLLTFTKTAKRESPICFLCKGNVSYEAEKTGYSELCKFVRPKEKKIVHFPKEEECMMITGVAQAKLTSLSCTLLIEQVAAFGLCPLMQKMVSRGNVRTIYGRECLPSYYLISACYQIAMKAHISVILKMRQASHTIESSSDPYKAFLFFRPKNGKLELALPEKSDEGAPSMVVEGQYCLDHNTDTAPREESQKEYCKRLLEWDLLRLLEFDGAAHTQFVDENESGFDKIPLLKSEPEEKKRLIGYLAEAERSGAFFTRNQSLLGVTHVFPSTLSKQREEMRGKNMLQLSNEEPKK